jgi:hypothetical protein
MLARKCNFKKIKKIRRYLVQKIIENEFAEIKIETRIKTDIKLSNDRRDIYIYDKNKEPYNSLIEIGVTSIENIKWLKTKNSESTIY